MMTGISVKKCLKACENKCQMVTVHVIFFAFDENLINLAQELQPQSKSKD